MVATGCRGGSSFIEEYFDATDWGDEWSPRYNLAPTQPVPVIRQHPKELVRQISLMRWGLIPNWARDKSIAGSTVSAKSETAATKPAFREPLKYRRCVVPADGFYEWKRKGLSKQPYCFEMTDGELFAFAGLWDGWKDSQGNWIKTCSILTTMPNAVAGIVHDRMPVILLVLFGATLTYSANCQDHQESAAKHATTEEEQAPKTVSESVAGPLRFVEASFVGLAEAVPEDKYGFIPTNGKFDGVRSFGEQIKHVACAQFAFFNEFEGKEPPADCEKGGLASTRTKAELIKYLKDSFDYGDRVIATLNEKNALDRVEGRYAGTDTKLGISVVALWYITDHYGQLVEYLRMNGVVPPMTQKYGLKVR